MTLEDLQLCARYRREIKRIEESIESLRSDMERVTQALSFAPARTEGGDKLAGKVAQLVELERKRVETKAAMEAHIDLCEAWLLTIPEQQAAVMRCRYMDGMKWEAVAKKTCYGKRHCLKIRDSAVKKMDVL